MAKTRIYDALENAGQMPAIGGEPFRPDKVSAAAPGLRVERKMIALYQSICALTPAEAGRSVQLVSAHPREGTSRIARGLACAAGIKLGKKVALIDADAGQSGQASAFGVRVIHGLDEAIDGERPIKEVLVGAAGGRLSIGQLTAASAVAPTIFNMPATGAFLDSLKQQYELVVIDSPPVGVAPEALGLCDKVDGVVLVVQAERTRREVVENVRDNIVQRGGRVLGVVLNRRRYYIPKFIYDRI